ncbi:MAG TPA: hypothetical protein VLG92_05745 [Candidatus Saccharimonadia bacterium]|nr:hypothetical protein [Candidatus Saccharimonadia bacterium]
MNSGIHPFHGHYTWGGLAALACCAVVVPAFWALLNILSPWDDHREMFKQHNAGFAIVRCFQLLGLAFGLAPVIGMTGSTQGQHVLWAAADAVWVPMLLLASTPIISRVVRHAHGGLNSIRDNSVPVSLVYGMFYLGYGQIIGATLPGPGLGLVKTYLISVVFGLLGIVCLTLIYLAAMSIRAFKLEEQPSDDGLNADAQKLSLAQLVRDGNWPATIGAMVIIYSLYTVISSAVAGAFTNWGDAIVSFLVAVVIMLVLAAGTIWLVDRFVVVEVEEVQGDPDNPGVTTTKDLLNVRTVVRDGAVLPMAVIGAFVLALVTLVANVVM